MSVFCIVTFVRAQDANPASALAARRFETGEPLRRFVETPLSVPAAGKSAIRVQPGPWTMHLVGELAKHPELKRRQLQIILEALELSTAAVDTHTLKPRSGNALQNLRRRALAAFTKNEVASLFDKVDGEQDQEEIITRYFDLSSLPLKGRRAAFKIAPAGDKSGLWRTHLAFSLLNHPEFNEWQKEIILAGILLATPEYFDVPSSSPDWRLKVREPSRALERQIALAFSREDAAKIFATLGANTEAAKRGPTNAGSALLKSVNYERFSDANSYRWTPSRFSSQDFESEQSSSCDCNMDSDYCPIWKTCKANSCNSQNGCGTFWMYPCNGVCR